MKLTSLNHTGFAGFAAVGTADCSLEVKVAVVVVLALSHVLLDAIPHMHFYGYIRLKETLPGAILELGGGFIVLPALIWYFTNINPWWLYSCVLSSSLVDFLVAARIRPIVRLNEIAHWWDKRVSSRALIPYEIAQTIITFGLLWWVIK